MKMEQFLKLEPQVQITLIIAAAIVILCLFWLLYELFN